MSQLQLKNDITGPAGPLSVESLIAAAGAGRTTVLDEPRGPDLLQVAQVWNDLVLDVKHFAQGPQPVTVGSSTGLRWRYLGAPIAWVPQGFARLAWLLGPSLSEASEEWKNDFCCPSEALPHEDFPLFSWDEGQWICHLADDWQGELRQAGQKRTLAVLKASGALERDEEGGYRLPLERSAQLEVVVGGARFFAQLVRPGKRVRGTLRASLDYPFLAMTFLLAFMGAMFGLVLSTMPPAGDADFIELPERFAVLMLEQPQVAKSVEPEENPDPGEGAKAKRDEGRRGKEEAKMKEAKGDAVELDRQRADKEIAEQAGVLGALRPGSELDGVFGAVGLDESILGGIGGLIGAKGVRYGNGGLGSRGSGLGGGGTAYDIGGLGNKGRSAGNHGYGEQGGVFAPGKRSGDINPGGDIIVLGSLDRAQVDEVVRRHLNQIRYCYQRELTKAPDLMGKVVVRFVIARDGSVSTAETKSSSLGNPAVESCLNGRFMRFEFPRPAGGGMVIVSYPFIFAPG